MKPGFDGKNENLFNPLSQSLSKKPVQIFSEITASS